VSLLPVHRPSPFPCRNSPRAQRPPSQPRSLGLTPLLAKRRCSLRARRLRSPCLYLLSRSRSFWLAVPRRGVGRLRVPTSLMAARPRRSFHIGMLFSRWPPGSGLLLRRLSLKLFSGLRCGCVRWCAAPRRGRALTPMAGR
jgi:hypothetical protein